MTQLCDARHEKTNLKEFVIVIPKEGWAPDFSEYDSADIIDYILEKLVSYKKKDATCAHPSFGITTTKTLRSVFSWHASIMLKFRHVLCNLL